MYSWLPSVKPYFSWQRFHCCRWYFIKNYLTYKLLSQFFTIHFFCGHWKCISTPLIIIVSIHSTFDRFQCLWKSSLNMHDSMAVLIPWQYLRVEFTYLSSTTKLTKVWPAPQFPVIFLSPLLHSSSNSHPAL